MAALRLAHRGDWRRAPENTIAAFEEALAIPACDGLELDVRPSADGVPVVIHDATLARVQGRRDRVGALSAAALANLGIPTLEAVLALAPPTAFLNVELKSDPGRALGPVLAAGRGPALDGAVVSSFVPAILAGVGGSQPTWSRWLNARDLQPGTVRRAVDLGCTGISVSWRSIHPRGLERVRAAGLVLAAWTVRDLATYRRLEDLGVVAICAEAEALDG